MCSNLNLKVTIVIPTYNRYDYLYRILDYYSSYKFPARILILDSSTQQMDRKRFREFLSCNRLIFRTIKSDTYPYNKISRGVQEVKTPYCVFCADDDFINPHALEECVSFLDSNEDYCLAHGFYSRFYLQANKGKSKFIWNPEKLSQSIENDNPSTRLKYYLSNYTATFYALHRTWLMKLIWSEEVRYSTDGRLGEILPAALSLIYGKMKILPVFYGAREIIISSGGVINDPWEVIQERDDFNVKYNKVIDCLVKHLQKNKVIDAGHASKVAHLSMDTYLKSVKKNRWYGLRSGIKNIIIGIGLYKFFLLCWNIRNRVINTCRIFLQTERIRYAEIMENKNSRYYLEVQRVKEKVVKYKINIIPKKNFIKDYPKKVISK